MLKAVLDTSVFVAGYLSRTGQGYPSQILQRWRNGEFQLIMSKHLLEEIVGKFIEKEIDEELILEFVETIGKIALNIPGLHIVYRLDEIDPDDNILLAAAQEGQADYLVSLDAKHVLPLKYHMGTQIVRPELFLRALNPQKEHVSMVEDDESEEVYLKSEIAKELDAARKERGRDIHGLQED